MPGARGRSPSCRRLAPLVFGAELADSLGGQALELVEDRSLLRRGRRGLLRRRRRDLSARSFRLDFDLGKTLKPTFDGVQKCDLGRGQASGATGRDLILVG